MEIGAGGGFSRMTADWNMECGRGCKVPPTWVLVDQWARPYLKSKCPLIKKAEKSVTSWPIFFFPRCTL